MPEANFRRPARETDVHDDRLDYTLEEGLDDLSNPPG